MSRYLVIWLVLATGQAQPTTPATAADQLRLLDAAVVSELLIHDLEALLAEGPGRPAGVTGTIRQLDLSLRAGRRVQAASLIDHLGELGIDAQMTRAVLEFLSDRRELDLAARLMERVPGSGREWASKIVEHWLSDPRKSSEEIDRWLADRGWMDERINFNVRLNTHGPLVTRIITEARSQPCDRTSLDQVLTYSRRGSAPVNLDWVPEWCHTRTASDASDLGVAARWSFPALAAVFFERALAMPFTDEDVGRETRDRAIVPTRTSAEWERGFRARIRLELAEAYRASGDVNRAQATLRDLTSEERSMIADTEFAGIAGLAQVQSGARLIEQEIRAEELVRSESRDYWLARARYFVERGEDRDARDAFDRALKIARTEHPGRHATQFVLNAYGEYLTSTEAHVDAWRLLRRELEAGSTIEDEWIFDSLARLLDDEDALIADAEWIWPLLEKRADWEHATSLLDSLVGATPRENRSAVVQRSLALVTGGDPRRVLPLARALLQAGEGTAAVPLFEQIISKLEGAEAAKVEKELSGARRAGLRQRFEADLARDDWRAAEQSWRALVQIEPASLETASSLASAPSTLLRLAKAAALKGDRADALRLWRAAANVDRATGLLHLGGFPVSQHRAELIAFYEAMAERDPGSWVPAAALEKLRR